MLAGVPTTYVAARARGTGAAAKPLAVTLLSGMALGALAQAHTALQLETWEKLWFFDIALGQNRGAWVGLGAAIGGVGAVVAFNVLSVGLRAFRRTPAVLDAEERFGVPQLAAARHRLCRRSWWLFAPRSSCLPPSSRGSGSEGSPS